MEVGIIQTRGKALVVSSLRSGSRSRAPLKNRCLIALRAATLRVYASLKRFQFVALRPLSSEAAYNTVNVISDRRKRTPIPLTTFCGTGFLCRLRIRPVLLWYGTTIFDTVTDRHARTSVRVSDRVRTADRFVTDSAKSSPGEVLSESRTGRCDPRTMICGGREDGAAIVQSADAFLFDCDGVLYHGTTIIEGVQQTLAYLRKEKKQVIFVTNNATQSRVQFAQKLRNLGVEAELEEVYCSAYAAATYFKNLNFTKTAFVVGVGGIEDELANAGIATIGGTKFPLQDLSFEEVSELPIDEAIGAVVAGSDPRICFAKLAVAAELLKKSECLFVATNNDASMNAANGRILPGAGAIIAAIEKISGRSATVVGKPSQLLLDIILREHKLDRKRTVMVGDRLDTDILFGHGGGLRTLLVMSGVQKSLNVIAENGVVLPNYVLPSVDFLRPT